MNTGVYCLLHVLTGSVEINDSTSQCKINVMGLYTATEGWMHVLYKMLAQNASDVNDDND